MELSKKVDIAVQRLKELQRHTLFGIEPYYLADSGGKDSCCIRRLAEMAGVQYEVHHNLTTVDPPELVKFIREHHPDAIIHRPPKNMWQLIEENGIPPLRQMRYCCRVLKESGGHSRFVITGVRHEESRNRSKRRMVESCYRNSLRMFLHPIIDWTKGDVWEFIKAENIPYCPLYDEGFSRLGCVMCPNSGKKGMAKEAARWPKIAEGYRKACGRAFDKIIQNPKKTIDWKSGDDMYEWWLSGGKSAKKKLKGIVEFDPEDFTLYEG